MGLFSRKSKDPIVMFEGQLAAVRTSWQFYDQMPRSVQSNATSTMPNALRKGYQAAHAVDPTHADALVADARRDDVAGGPSSLSWLALLDYAVSS